MQELTHKTLNSGRWSPRKSLLVVAIGAALGWVAAIVAIYGLLRGLDADPAVQLSPTIIAEESDFRALSDIAPASGSAHEADPKDVEKEDPKP